MQHDFSHIIGYYTHIILFNIVNNIYKCDAGTDANIVNSLHV